MSFLESLQPRRAEICCTHDVLNNHKVKIFCMLKQWLGQILEIFKQETTENCQNTLTVKQRRVKQSYM